MNLVQKVVGGKCPNCESEKVFQSSGNILLFKAPKMNATCSHCSHKYEAEPGFFFGAMFVSYALIVAELMGVYILLHSLVSNTEAMIAIVFLVILLTSFTNFKYSRLIWMYLFTPAPK